MFCFFLMIRRPPLSTLTYTLFPSTTLFRSGSATATVSVTVTPLPDSPVAQDDEAVTTIDTPVSIDVLGNDDDPDGDPLMVDGFTQPTNGTVASNADGTLRYTPDSGFTGSDSFTIGRASCRERVGQYV